MEKNPFLEVPTWFRKLVGWNFMQAWLSSLQDSIIHDFTKHRIGTLIDPFNSNCFCDPSIEWLVKWKIPVWYAWGPNKETLLRFPHFSSLAYLRPPPDKLQLATMFLARSPLYAQPRFPLILTFRQPFQDELPHCNPILKLYRLELQ